MARGFGLGWLRFAVCLGLFACQRGPAPAKSQVAFQPAMHGPAAHAPDQCSYTFAVDKRLSALSATLCCPRSRLAALEPTDDIAATLLRSAARVSPDGTLLEPARVDGGGAVRFDEDSGQAERPRGAAAPECAQYVVDLARATRTRSGLMGARRREDALLISPDLWLWRPIPLPRKLVAHFELPAGMQVAVPWPRSGEGYEIPASAFNFRGQSAFGNLKRSQLNLAGTEVELVRVGTRGPAEPRLRAWLGDAGRAVSMVHGRMPAERALVLVLGESGRRRGFGLTLRGGGASIVMLLGDATDAADGQALASDWTAVHELLHLGLPHTDPADAWLREGLTTYYTTLSRARAGFLSREQAWHELLDGFERGKRTGTGRTLRDESAAMHQSGAYWRVYWAGAALALLADVELRRAGSRDGLDGPMRAIASCCASSDELWDSERLARELDRAAHVPVIERLAAKHLDEPRFPDLEPTTEFLGVHPLGSSIELDPKAPGAQIRDAILPKTVVRASRSGQGRAGLQKK
jgi:hypothetical protein